jgi:hypothetical protein
MALDDEVKFYTQKLKGFVVGALLSPPFAPMP